MHSSWMILTVLAEKSLALSICSDDFDHARTPYHTSTHFSGCQTIWRSLPKAWCKASCLEFLISIEVLPHRKRDPSRYLSCLTMLSGTPPRSGLQAKSFLLKIFLFRFTYLLAMSFCGPLFDGHYTDEPSCNDGSVFLGHTTSMQLLTFPKKKHPNIGGVDHPDDGQWHVASPLDALNVSKKTSVFSGNQCQDTGVPCSFFVHR